MGEVYRATDTNLHRDVAIKVLPPEVAQDPERLGRFKREAHLLAALNHPNIAAIYGLEEADGKPFLALELVEGEDLKERLARGAIPVDEALEIAKQIAEALEEAHGKGIVHRDLKPANVKLTPDGKVKVLDFGLAKAWAGDASGVNSGSAALSQSPTLAHTGTIAGVILGTAAYMSPEQARGKPVDKRADVWSFGVLVWEMLTGRSLFAGDTVTDVIAAVVTREPDLDALPQATPRAVRRLLSRCLRKDPRTRLPDMGAARLELQEAIAGTSAEAEAPAALDAGGRQAERRGRTRERWAWAAVALLAAGLAAGFAFVHLTQVPAPTACGPIRGRGPGRLDVRGLRLAGPVSRRAPDRVPGGSRGRDRCDAMLWTRPLESLTPRLLAGTEGADHSLLVSGRPVPRVRRRGRAPQAQSRRRHGAADLHPALSRAPAETGTRTAPSSSRRAAARGHLFTVAATGGEPKPLLVPDAKRGETGLVLPQFLPGGRRLLFNALGEGEAVYGAHVASLDRPAEQRFVVPGLTRCVPAAGHLLFVRNGTLLAQPFDADRAELSGEPVTIATSVGAWAANAGVGWFAASPTDTLAYFSGQSAHRTGAARVARPQGRAGRDDRRAGQLRADHPLPRRAERRPRDPRRRGTLRPLGDGRRARGDEPRDRHTGRRARPRLVPRRALAGLHRAQRRGGRPAAQGPAGERARDGAHGLAGRGRSRRAGPGRADAPLRPADRRGREERLGAAAGGRGQARARPGRAFRVDEPHLSPDGRWLAYVSLESGQNEVYVEPFRREGDRVRVSVEGGGQPKWRGDGKELFFTRHEQPAAGRRGANRR